MHLGDNISYSVKFRASLYGNQAKSDIMSMLSSGLIYFDAQVRGAKDTTWFGLMEHSLLGHYVASKLILTSTSQSTESLFNYWYVKQGDHSFGPFSIVQILEFFCQERIQFHTLLRHPSEVFWTQMQNSGLFSISSLHSLLACPHLMSIISRRRDPRLPYHNPVAMSVNANLFHGVTANVSRRGLKLITDHPTTISLGDRINLKIRHKSTGLPLQIRGRVVNIVKSDQYERVAVEFEHEHQEINVFIDQHIPRPPAGMTG